MNEVSNIDRAREFVLHTAEHVFLTGKAGTGKTTFLREIRNNTLKKTVTTAPTGVAAINAGGMTLHSFFQIPFGLFVPEEIRNFDDQIQLTTPTSLFYNIKLNKAKRELIREMELLIIDEVSMLRCDTFDMIDMFLRGVRRRPDTPFGGVQVLLIGDLYQLPPVVNDEQWSILSTYYTTPFFFSARVMQQTTILPIELDKIYRQSDTVFIDLLQHVRNNEMHDSDFALLNERYQPEAIYGLENYITLCTHNWKADKINISQLQRLQADEKQFEAQIHGDFPERSFPTEQRLVLKQGAQVMFIKNDSSPEKRYYNGKLATIKRIYDDEIVVNFFDTREEYTISKETWKNIRYQYDIGNDKIIEDELGSFEQYPIRLAWAVTIHKSQGLTFERAVIDAGQAFAAGQVYVALSRCTRLEGLFLLTPIPPGAILTDDAIVAYMSNHQMDTSTLDATLERAKDSYSSFRILQLFDWTKMRLNATELKMSVEEKQLPDKENVLRMVAHIIDRNEMLYEVAEKFRIQARMLFEQGDLKALEERLSKAVTYFYTIFSSDILQVLDEHIATYEKMNRVKKYIKEVIEIRSVFYQKLQMLEQVEFNNTKMYQGSIYHSNKVNTSEVDKPKAVKGATKKISFDMYKEGLNISEIAAQRHMAESTIEGHLATFIETGELSATDFMDQNTLDALYAEFMNSNITSLTAMREQTQEKYSFSQLRIALAHIQYLKSIS